jgi:hypothetical protein
MVGRLATDAEVAQWREQGWVLLEGLVDTADVDAAAEELPGLFPTAEDFRADPEGVTRKWKGDPIEPVEAFAWPDEGPGFRSAQHRWLTPFPFEGAPNLNRLCVHGSVVDFARRALGSEDVRLYQAHASAKYAGVTNYEQPLHTDRNHSWLAPVNRAPWWNLEGFLYLSDVTEDANPTALVSLSDSQTVPTPFPVVLPGMTPDMYELERPAPGIRGSYLAYRSDTWHRGTDFATPDAARFVAALAFKQAAHEWIGYDTQQSKSTDSAWTTFVEGSTPGELELFGFPPPGHPIWSDDVLAETAERYPGLDLGPWHAALASTRAASS